MSQLTWQCRRGVRELDELLQRYYEQHYPQASGEEQRAFERLLCVQDMELQAYVLSFTDPDDPEMRRVVSMLREHRA